MIVRRNTAPFLILALVVSLHRPHASAGQSQKPQASPPTGTHEHPAPTQGMPPRSALKPAKGARIKIMAPREGQVVRGDEVPIRYNWVKGKGGHHLHAYVDQELMGMFSHPTNGILTGIQRGRHTLELRVVAEDHQTELDATDSVRFTVE